MAWVDRYVVNKTPSRNQDTGGEVDKNVAGTDPLADIKERVNHKFFYRPEEQGIFHSIHHQGLKLRNNGAAELFTDQDTGIRLDPGSQSINAFANHYKSHVHDKTEWLTGTANHYVKEHWRVKTKGKHIVISEDNIEIQTKKNMTITIDKDENVTIKGSMNLNVSGSVSAEIGGNLEAKVKRHATIDVGKTLALKSKHLKIEADTYDVPWMPHEHPQYALVGHSHPK